MGRFFLSFLPFLLSAQTFQRVIAPFPVVVDGEGLEAPFLGGVNKPIPQFVDWDGDGLKDLFLKDTDERLQYLRNVGTVSEASFELVTKAFQGLIVGNWFNFHDYDNDSDLDLMCHSNGSDVALHENVNDELILRTSQLLTDSSVAVNGGSVVVPTAGDIDSDGLLDYFIGSVSGTVTYYKNLGLIGGLPNYHLESNSFEDISIVWVPGRDERHGANALDFFDINSDDDLDLFWGDFFQPGLFFLENIGTAQDPDIPDSLMITSYPEEDSVWTAGYNVPRLSDLDGDGDAELFVGVLSGAYGTDNSNNFWYYENIGTPSNPQFVLETKNFIESLELYSNSVPALADIDNDSDLDLFIGNELDPPSWAGTVYYFENIGSSLNPSFVLTNSNFFGDNLGNNLAPTFADIDGDGDQDGFVGDWNGKIFYFENTGSPTQPSFANSVEFLNIDLSGYSTPIFGDIDQDIDLDFFIGDKNGKIHFWENEGSITNPDFRSENEDYFPEFDLGEKIIPSLYDYENDGDLDFFIGNETGQLFLIKNTSGIFELEEMTSFPYSGINIAPTVVDIDSDGKPELIVGSRTGGLQYFQVDFDLENISVDYLLGWNLVGLSVDVEDASQLSVYPSSVEETLYGFSGSYVNVDVLVLGEGYWLNFPEAGSTTITGTLITSLTVSLNEGWNLFSGISEVTNVSGISDPGGIIVPNTVYEFTGSYSNASMLIPGHGYWINASADGDITISSSTAAKTISAFTDRTAKANKLSFNGSDLYFGVSIPEEEKLSYQLPPKPPLGAFDVRFRGDTRIAGENTKIEVMSPYKRLTVSYDVIIDAGEKMNWVLTSTSGTEYTLEGTGKITVPSAERFTLERKAVIPLAFTLHQNYPNPFNPITTFYYDLPKRAHITLMIYDLLGRPVKVFANAEIESGSHQVTWNGTNDSGKMVSAGIYLCVLKSDTYAQTMKMILLK